MYQIALTNPFSQYSTRIIRKYSDFEDFIKNMNDEAFILAGDKLEVDNLNINLDIDIYSFYILFISASKFGIHSMEGRAILGRLEEIIAGRVKNISENNDFYIDELDPNLLSEISGILSPVPLEDFRKENRISEKDLNILDSIVDKKQLNIKVWMRKKAFALKWNETLPAISQRDLSLTSLYFTNHHVILSSAELLDFYIATVVSHCKDFIEKLHQAKIHIRDPRLKDIGTKLGNYSEKTMEINYSHLKIQKNLERKFFPPCVLNVLNGVSSGARNYGISVFLTSFLSYARIAPLGASKDSNISDFINDEKVIMNEIIPIIESAASNCNPPLFEDHPQERLNVFYHLGFGLTENPKIGDSGRSNWYFVPNCEKIRREAPAICWPDKDCKTIKNPLSYYVKMSGIYKEAKNKKEKKGNN